jgi:SPP1 gp7 family putative phage head morphogenesis protein
MIQKLQGIENKTAYWQLVAKKILRFWKDVIFQPLADIQSQKLTVENAASKSLIAALRSGRIFYADGAFRSKGRFSNAISRELEDMGAIWSRREKAFMLAAGFIPMDVSHALAVMATQNQDKIERMRVLIRDLQGNIDAIVRQVKFEDEFNRIVEDGEDQFSTVMRKINVIPYEIDESRKKVLREEYTTNLDFYIKKWTADEIEKLRTDVEGIVMEGYRYDTVAKMIQTRYNVSARKASFLARNETKILVAKYQQDRFQSYGVNFYQWKTNMDGRERKLHAILNGTIQNWEDPPIIGDKGEKGNPGEIYNCRCKALPLLPNDARIKDGNRKAVLV